MYENNITTFKNLSNKLSEKQKKHLHLDQIIQVMEHFNNLDYDPMLSQIFDALTRDLEKIALKNTKTSDFNQSYKALKNYLKKEYHMQSTDQVVTESKGAGIAIGMGIGFVLLPRLGSGALAIGFAIGIAISQFSAKNTCRKLKNKNLLY